MTEHCPGFESNKTLTEVTIRCPECGKEWEIFSDEVGKTAKCSGCGISVDTAQAKVSD